MDKRIIVGLVAGLILGVIEMFAFGGGATLLLYPPLVLSLVLLPKNLPYNTYLVSALLGALSLY
ncbi:MAG: hypothetical protein IPN94_20875 [Sphingobacteriales bacterium]|nr:hypothetical protein [Sphingobacteriales bacterium]